MLYTQHKSEESMEDYLETILILKKEHANVRSIDIANQMNFKKSSVSVAMKNLREQAYITVDEDGYIKLTPTGQKKAKSTYERHQLLTRWLVSLGVNEEIAAEDACRMEHDISDISFHAIKKCINQLLGDI